MGVIANSSHVTVLKAEAVESLIWNPDGVYVDGTFGRGGHSRLILNQLTNHGRLVAIDKDIAAAHCALGLTDSRFSFAHDSFQNFDKVLKKYGLTAVDGVLLDLGVSSPQFDIPARGFSFRMDGPLDMRMNQTVGPTAYEWLCEADESELATVFWEYGEERFAKKIAQVIVQQRQIGKFTNSTLNLANIIAQSVPRVRNQNHHPATRVFQAIRIKINDELTELSSTLAKIPQWLKPGGRIVVISFHSLEDRIVKRFFQKESGVNQRIQNNRERYLPVQKQASPCLKLVKKLKPTAEELVVNHRARSAVMRVAERLQADVL